VDHGSAASRALRQWSVAWNRQVGLVSGRKKSRQQIEQATLRAA
jgi:hypothetical protein